MEKKQEMGVVAAKGTEYLKEGDVRGVKGYREAGGRPPMTLAEAVWRNGEGGDRESNSGLKCERRGSTGAAGLRVGSAKATSNFPSSSSAHCFHPTFRLPPPPTETTTGGNGRLYPEMW